MSVLATQALDVLESLDCLRVLTGPVCRRCLDTDGELIPATFTDDHQGYAPPTDLCDSCANREPGDHVDANGASYGEWNRP